MFGLGFRFGSGFGVRFGAALAEPGTDTQETEPRTRNPRTPNVELRTEAETEHEPRSENIEA
jgi:hypothetical protein